MGALKTPINSSKERLTNVDRAPQSCGLRVKTVCRKDKEKKRHQANAQPCHLFECDPEALCDWTTQPKWFQVSSTNFKDAVLSVFIVELF